jgi:excinuclease ABC subunit A
VRSNLFGVVYVLDEPSAGLHPADTEALLAALDRLKQQGNSLFVVEHEIDVIRHADWIVDVGPDAGVHGGEILYSGPPEGLAHVEASHTRVHLFRTEPLPAREPRPPQGMLELEGITRNNLDALDVAFPLGVLTSVTGVSGSGKSSLVSQALVELVSGHLGATAADDANSTDADEPLDGDSVIPTGGRIVSGLEDIKRLVRVDQQPIGRTPRSNLATYTGLFDHVVAQLDALVEAGNTVIVVEHDMRVVAASDWVIDIGPGAGEEGGQIIAAGTPTQVARARESRTAPYLTRFFADGAGTS